MKTTNSTWMVLVTLVAALVVTSSCAGSGRQEAPDGPIPDSAYSAMGNGTVYLLIGDPGSGNVWQVDLHNHRNVQLTHNRNAFGVSWLSASTAGLTLADASSGVDMVSVYRNNQARNLAGYGGAPAISATGAVAYIEVPDVVNQAVPQPWRIGVIPIAGGTSRVLYQQDSPDLGALAYGPDGQLAAISAPGPRNGQGSTPEVLVLSPDGTVKARVSPNIGEVGFLAWNDKAPGIAIGGLSGHSELINPTSGTQTALPNNWTPQCWSPDGTSLIVTQQDHIGIWRTAAPTRVDDLGPMPTKLPLTGCSWLTTPAANT